MPIRREDKEFIQALSLLGALLGACIGIFGIAHIADRARQQDSAQSEYHQTQAALLKLSSTITDPASPIADENVLDQVQQQIEQAPAQEAVPEESFWTGLPRWGYLGLCGAGGVIGAAGGYFGIWTTGWCGTIFIYYLIRFLYRVIRKVAPGYAAKIHLQPVSGGNTAERIQSQREDGRILPAMVKLFFLLVFVLGILAAVVWHLTAI